MAEAVLEKIIKGVPVHARIQVFDGGYHDDGAGGTYIYLEIPTNGAEWKKFENAVGRETAVETAKEMLMNAASDLNNQLGYLGIEKSGLKPELVKLHEDAEGVSIYPIKRYKREIDTVKTAVTGVLDAIAGETERSPKRGEQVKERKIAEVLAKHGIYKPEASADLLKLFNEMMQTRAK